MSNLTTRSAQKELLDMDAIPFADIKQNMHELNLINTWLGGHAITIAGFRQIASGISTAAIITVCEIGCGGGDNLAAIYKYCLQKKIGVQFIGIDIKQECISFAKQQYPDLPAQWICSDYAVIDFNNNKPDIIFSSLFCHHFNEKELILMLQWMKVNSSKGFFINDLHRNVLAYFSIKLITRIFSNSYLVKNDAPLSVARGFKKAEWQSLLKLAGITTFSLQWRWAFRHLIIYKNG